MEKQIDVWGETKRKYLQYSDCISVHAHKGQLYRILG